MWLFKSSEVINMTMLNYWGAPVLSNRRDRLVGSTPVRKGPRLHRPGPVHGAAKVVVTGRDGQGHGRRGLVEHPVRQARLLQQALRLHRRNHGGVEQGRGSFRSRP